MVKLDAWDECRIAHYKEQIVANKIAAEDAIGERMEALLADITMLEDVVHRMENGAPPPKPIAQKEYYIEPEDEGCEGGACKI